LDDALFAASLENLRVAPRLKQMVGDYSGWAWINDEPLRLLEPPSIQQLHRINIPTLVIVGERDVPDFLATADTLHQRIPKASKVVMAGVGHMSNMEDPELFNKTVREFLANKGSQIATVRATDSVRIAAHVGRLLRRRRGSGTRTRVGSAG